MSKNDAEDSLVEQLDDKRLADLYLPAIKEIIKSGGGAEAILKKSEALAACRLAASALSDKPDTALKASIEILNRVQGKPVERRLSIYGDLADMSEDQLDREIYALAKRAGVKDVIDVLAEERPKAALPVKKTRRGAASPNVKIEPNGEGRTS